VIEQTDTEQADPVLKTTSESTTSDARQEAAAPLGKPAAAMQPELAAGVEPLVRAREALGLGASDIAAKLGMATRQIEALERGDWQALPGQAFVRGALRSYGKSVGVDVAPLLAAIGGQVAAPELRSSASLDAAMPKRGTLGFGSSGSGGSGGRLIWIVLGVAAVIAMALYFGDAFEIGRSADRDEAVVAGDDPRASADGAGAGVPAASGTASGAATRAAGSESASSSGAAAPGAAASGSATPGTAASGAAASGAASVSPSGDTSGSGGGLAQLAPLTPLVPLAPAPSAAQAPGDGATPAGPGAQGAGTAAGASAAAGPATPAAPGAAGSDTGAAPGAATGSDAGATAPNAGTRSAEAGAASTSDPAAASSAPSGAGSTSIAPAAGDGLRLRFDRESWVDIRDGAGKVLLQGTQPAGSSRELSGAPPFKLVIGNAAHVSLERNGQAVELGKRTRSGVARLTLE